MWLRAPPVDDGREIDPPMFQVALERRLGVQLSKSRRTVGALFAGRCWTATATTLWFASAEEIARFTKTA